MRYIDPIIKSERNKKSMFTLFISPYVLCYVHKHLHMNISARVYG